MPVNVLAGRAAELPDASIGGPLGVSQLDGADRLVERHAGIPELQAKALDNDVGIADLVRLAHQPVANGQRQAESLVGKSRGGFRRGNHHANRLLRGRRAYALRRSSTSSEISKLA